MENEEMTDLVDIDEEKEKLVIFTLMNEYYAFYGVDVKEIQPYSPITYVPGTPDFIAGIINVRGDIESVLNIHAFMGFTQTEEHQNCRIVIVEKNDIRSGILMDSVADVVDVPVSLIHPPLSILHQNVKDFVIGETTYNSKIVILLDVGKVFEKMLI